MTGQTLRSENPSASGGGRSTPGMVVVGWLVLCFAVIPLAMAVRGEGHIYTNLAVGLLLIGALLITIPRFGPPRGNTPGPSGVAG